MHNMFLSRPCVGPRPSFRFLRARLLPAGLLLVMAAAAAAGAQTLAEKVTVSTLAEAPAGSGGISIGPDGRIYTADFGAKLGDPTTAGKKIYAVTKKGEVELFAEGLEGASGHAWGADGSLYQSNIRGKKITRIASDGTQSTFTSEGVVNPVGIVIDDDGTLWVANCGAQSIQKVTPDGTSTRFVTDPLLACPNGMAIDDDHNLYAAAFYSGDVVKIAPDGTVSKLATLPGNNNGHVTYAAGALWVVARSAHQIYRVSLEGEVALVAGTGEKGGADGAGTEASFCYPNDIAASADGKTLYVNEIGDETSQGFKLDPTRIRVLQMR